MELPGLASLVSLDILGRGYPVGVFVGWTEKEFLVLQAIHVLLLAEHLGWGYHAALGFLKIVELELRVAFGYHCLFFGFTT